MRILDLDGSFEFSNVIFVQTDCDDQDFIVYPNPINKNNGAINIQFKTQRKNLQIEITDILGTIVKSLDVVLDSNTTTTLQILLDDLPSGSYYLKIEGFKEGKMFVIQK